MMMELKRLEYRVEIRICFQLFVITRYSCIALYFEFNTQIFQIMEAMCLSKA